jgi:hypothetical protein
VPYVPFKTNKQTKQGVLGLFQPHRDNMSGSTGNKRQRAKEKKQAEVDVEAQ